MIQLPHLLIPIISIAMAPWMLYSWIPVGLLLAYLEGRVLNVCHYWEYGERAQLRISFNGFIVASLLGYLMLVRTAILPFLLAGAYAEKRHRLADNSLSS